MSDPYQPQPQQPDQPYSGQPYYPQQPPQYPPQPGPQQYGAQPSPYADPYAAQPYAAQSYSPQQQAYQQPGYPPGYGQQVPAGYPPQPPVKKRRTGLIVSAVVGVVALVACSGIVALALKFGSDGSTTPSGSATGTVKPATLKAPATIGTLKKSSDQAQAQTMSKAMTNAGLENPFAAVYEDTKNPGRRVVVWGGTGKIFNSGDAQTQLDSFFTGMGSELGGAKPVAVDMGAAGGKAECAKSTTSGVKLSICGWVGNDALLGFIFGALEPAAAGAQMRTLLPSIVS